MPKHLRVYRQQLQAFLLGLGQQQAVKRIALDAAVVLLNGQAAESNNPNHAAERPDDAYLLTDAHKRFGKYISKTCTSSTASIWK